METKDDNLVRFKSGSPIMIVRRSHGVEALCAWFTLNGRYQEEWIKLSHLEKVEKGEAKKIIKKTNENFEDFEFLDLNE